MPGGPRRPHFAHLLWTIAEHPQRRGKLHMFFKHRLQGPFRLGMGVIEITPESQGQVLPQLQGPSMPGIRLLEQVDPAIHLLGCRPQNGALDAMPGHEVKGPWGAADDGLPDLHRAMERARHQRELAQLIPPVRDIGWQRILLPMMRERFLMARLHENRKLLFKQLAIRLRLQHRGAEGFHLTRMVAAPHAEDDPPVGEDVHHGKVLGQSQRMPHGQDIERTAESQSGRLLG